MTALDMLYARRLEQVNEDLRRRNGELFVALDEAGSAKRLTPIPDWPTRYVLLDRIVTLAAEIASERLRFGAVDDALLDELVDACDQHGNYWHHVGIERKRREDIAAKAKATREANKRKKGDK